MKRQAYPAYKDSGIKWMGKMPEHWSIVPLKRLTTCLDGKRVPLNAEERASRQGTYPYWGANGIVDCIDDWLFDEELVLLGEDGAPFFDSCKNVAFVVKGKIWVNNHIHVLRLRNGTNHYFLAQCLNIVDYGLFIEGSTRDKLTQGKMSNIPIQCPPLPEQRAIAAFLDRKTTHIDALIAKKERQIELLQEKRAALISHAVTKGLDPTVPMRDSGIEWLGKVPEHWNVQSLKTVALLQRGHDLPAQERQLGDIPVVSSSGTFSYHAEAKAKGPGVVTGRYGTIGKIIYVDQDYWPLNTTLYVKDFHGNSPRFIYYLLMILPFDAFSDKSAVPGVDRNDLHRLLVTCPPLDEQTVVVAYLDRETSNLDALTAKVQESIERLQEYRIALISAAVTGKIDVRGEEDAAKVQCTF